MFSIIAFIEIYAIKVSVWTRYKIFFCFFFVKNSNFKFIFNNEHQVQWQQKLFHAILWPNLWPLLIFVLSIQKMKFVHHYFHKHRIWGNRGCWLSLHLTAPVNPHLISWSLLNSLTVMQCFRSDLIWSKNIKSLLSICQKSYIVS